MGEVIIMQISTHHLYGILVWYTKVQIYFYSREFEIGIFVYNLQYFTRMKVSMMWVFRFWILDMGSFSCAFLTNDMEKEKKTMMYAIMYHFTLIFIVQCYARTTTRLLQKNLGNNKIKLKWHMFLHTTYNIQYLQNIRYIHIIGQIGMVINGNYFEYS